MTVAAEERLEYLVEGLGNNRVAQLLNVSKSQPSRRRSGKEGWKASSALSQPRSKVPTPDLATVYRLFPHVADRRPDEPGGPAFVPATQGAGRLDNPERYRVTYVTLQPEAAVGEGFGRFITWSAELLAGRPSLPGSRAALAIFDLDGALLDLDDARALVERDLRPSRVVTGDRAVTQRWALVAWQEQRWPGVRWWSYWNPGWTTGGVWDDTALRLRAVEPLSRDHPALRGVAAALNRPLAGL